MFSSCLRNLPTAAAAAILVGCSAGSAGSPAMPASTAASNASVATQVAPGRYAGSKDLYVSDFGTGDVVLLKNKTYKNVGSIFLNSPDGIFLDRKGNLYVASYAGVEILEYAPGGASPFFTYNAGMTDPIAASVDTSGNVYEGDYNDGSTGSVNEYRQKTNAVAYTCKPGASVEGVTVDSKRDVFVDYVLPSLTGKIVEYKGGLKGCSGTVLGVTLTGAGGLAIDKNANLIACNGVVVIIDPPYNHITGTLGSGYGCGSVSLDRANRLAFITDPADADVHVVDYSSGNS
jgi:hypothetical protein